MVEGENEKKVSLGGMLGGIWDLLGFLSEMEKMAERRTTESGEFKVGRAKATYHYSVRTIKGGEPTPRPGFGIRPGFRGAARPIKPSGGIARPKVSVAKPKVLKADLTESRESLVDVFDKGDYISVVVELPHVKEEDLKFEIIDDTLKITANTPEGKVEKIITIPKGAEVEKIEEASFKHGILEIKLSKQKEEKKKVE